MGLSPIMLKSLQRANYLEPTPIQAGLIPRALAGVDVMGQAQTGTGKTAAFAIPILERLEPHRKAAAAAGPGPGAHPRAGRPGPRRVRQAGRRAALHIVAVYGGKPIRKQIEQLDAGADWWSARPAACWT